MSVIAVDFEGTRIKAGMRRLAAGGGAGREVGGIEQEAEACEQVFDFLAAEEVDSLRARIFPVTSFSLCALRFRSRRKPAHFWWVRD